VSILLIPSPYFVRPARSQEERIGMIDRMKKGENRILAFFSCLLRPSSRRSGEDGHKKHEKAGRKRRHSHWNRECPRPPRNRRLCNSSSRLWEADRNSILDGLRLCSNGEAVEN